MADVLDNKTENTKSNTEDTSSKDLSIKQEGDSNFKSFTIPEVKAYVKNTTSGLESSSTTLNGDASVAVRDTGDVTLSAGILAHISCNKQYGSIEDVCLKKSISAPTCEIFTNDLIINNHKLNSKLYELSDWKKVLEKTSVTGEGVTSASSTDSMSVQADTSQYSSVTTNGTVGGLTMLGTVLTRSWDLDLGRYVLIRRLINIPVFSPNIGN